MPARKSEPSLWRTRRRCVSRWSLKIPDFVMMDAATSYGRLSDSLSQCYEIHLLVEVTLRCRSCGEGARTAWGSSFECGDNIPSRSMRLLQASKNGCQYDFLMHEEGRLWKPRSVGDSLTELPTTSSKNETQLGRTLTVVACARRYSNHYPHHCEFHLHFPNLPTPSLTVPLSLYLTSVDPS